MSYGSSTQSDAGLPSLGEVALARITLDPADRVSRSVWQEALALLDELEGGWTLVGGLMVQLHAARYGVAGARVTVDIDVLADSRERPSATERIARKLVDLGFEITERLVEPAVAFRFEREGTVVDLLAPEKTGARNPPKTIGNFHAVQIPGGTQALARTETVLVEIDGHVSKVCCPTLLGAILLKARAIRSAQREQDREDLVVLLSCVEDPAELRSELRGRERQWLWKAAETLAIDRADLSDRFDAGQLALARAALRLLVG